MLQGFYLNENTTKAISQLENLKNLWLLVCEFKRRDTMFPIVNLKNLEKLDPGICDENTDEFLVKVADNLKNLTEFVMFNPIITDIGVSALTKLDKLNSIAFQNYIGPKEITDVSMKKFKNMQKIFFMNYPLITDDSIIPIINNSPYLNTILIGRTSVTVKSVQHALNFTRDRTNNLPLFMTIDLTQETCQLQEKILPPNFKLTLY